jgi:hypothetical protein
VPYVNVGTRAGGLFVLLFLFRYTKLIVNTISWTLGKPYPARTHPNYRPENITVIIPSANPKGDEFGQTVTSALRSGAAKVIIVTFGAYNMEHARAACDGLPHAERLLIVDNVVENKRLQMCRGVSEVTSTISVFCDDDVFWPVGFLTSILAAFEDPTIGGVGMHK